MLHDEELCGLYRSVGVVRVVECGSLRWAGYVDTCVIFLPDEVRIWNGRSSWVLWGSLVVVTDVSGQSAPSLSVKDFRIYI